MKRLKRKTINPSEKQNEINLLIENIVQTEQMNIETLQLTQNKNMREWFDTNFGGYDYISLNGSSEINSKMKYFLSDSLNPKEIEGVISRINKTIKLWLQQEDDLELV